MFKHRAETYNPVLNPAWGEKVYIGSTQISTRPRASSYPLTVSLHTAGPRQGVESGTTPVVPTQGEIPEEGDVIKKKKKKKSSSHAA